MRALKDAFLVLAAMCLLYAVAWLYLRSHPWSPS